MGIRTIVPTVLVLFVAAVASVAGAGVWFDDYTLEVGERTRFFRFYVPENVGPSQPLVILLHGGGSSFEEVVASGGRALWPQVADEEGFVLAVPNGIDPQTGAAYSDTQSWHDCRDDATAGIGTGDDVAFIDTLVDWFLTRPNLDVDAERVHVAGLSIGGLMAYRLAAELPDRFAAIGVSIANMPQLSSCPAPAPISTLIVAGDEDSVYMPWSGGCVAADAECAQGSVRSAIETRDLWRTVAGADGEIFTRMRFPDRDVFDGAGIERERWLAADSRHELTFLRVIGGGHNLPTVDNPVDPQALSSMGLGAQSHDIETARVTWRFFERQRRGGAAASDGPGGVGSLHVDRDADGQLELRWSVECGGGEHYAIYRGDLALGPQSLLPEPGACELTGTSHRLAPGPADGEFFLVVPNDREDEGSYGFDSAGASRAPSIGACHGFQAPASCANDYR